MATAKLINCPKCGASIDAAVAVPGGAVECTYCGSSIAIQAPTPPQQQSPQVQIVVGRPGATTHTASQGIAVALGIVTSIFVSVFVAVVVFTAVRSSKANLTPTVKAVAGPVKLPATCPLNGTITVEDQDVRLDDTAITGSINCKIFVRRSKIQAPNGIKAGMNAEVTIEDSTILAERIAIEAGPNLKLRVHGKSVIASEETGITASTNADIRLDGAEVRADEVAIDGSINIRIDARNSKIEGKTALNLATNGDVTLRNSTLKGEKNLGLNGKLKEK